MSGVWLWPVCDQFRLAYAHVHWQLTRPGVRTTTNYFACYGAMRFVLTMSLTDGGVIYLVSALEVPIRLYYLFGSYIAFLAFGAGV